jgi:toxin ParE1/3/4
MRIRWMPLAEHDLDAVYEYIRRDNATAARKVVGQIFRAIEMLVRYPSAGRSGRVPGTRELMISRTPFTAVYRLNSEEIQILSIIHGARKWPTRLG